MINPNGASGNEGGAAAYSVPECRDLNNNKMIPVSEWGLQACSSFERFI
jgi:hypothetical protein